MTIEGHVTGSGDVLAGFNIYDPDLPAHFHDDLRLARQRCPVAHSEELGGYWLVTAYEDVKKVLSDPRTFISSEGIILGATEGMETNSLIETDPPLQRDFRRLLDRLFSRRHLESVEPAIREVAAGLVDGFVPAGRCEVMRDYAGPLTAAVLSTLVFGLDWETNREAILETAEAVEATSQNNGEAAFEARGVMDALARRLVAERRSSGESRDDIIDALITGSVAGRPLTEDEIVGNLTLFVGAGLDTTKAVIGSIAVWMVEDPAIEERLRDPAWTKRDLDEFLRLASPVTGVGRTVTADVVVGGRRLTAGDKVWALCSSANRDEGVFDHPDEIDFDRPRNPHVAFGMGVHRCIGSNLARLQIGVAFEALLTRVRGIRLEPGAEIAYSPGVVRHPVSVPVTFEAR